MKEFRYPFDIRKKIVSKPARQMNVSLGAYQKADIAVRWNVNPKTDYFSTEISYVDPYKVDTL